MIERLLLIMTIIEAIKTTTIVLAVAKVRLVVNEMTEDGTEDGK